MKKKKISKAQLTHRWQSHFQQDGAFDRVCHHQSILLLTINQHQINCCIPDLGGGLQNKSFLPFSFRVWLCSRNPTTTCFSAAVQELSL